MSDITPRRRSSAPSRGAREQRAFRLVQVGGGAAVVALAGIILAIVGVVGAWLPIVAIVVAVVCAVLFRRMVNPG
jgi:Flp pilus assembly protein TadB